MFIFTKYRLQAKATNEKDFDVYYSLIDWVNSKGQNPNCRKYLEKYWKDAVQFAPIRKDIKVYRGLHFDTADEYNSFLDQFNKNKKQYLSESISSWSKNKQIAIEYAQKSLYGLVLATWAYKNQAIDVTSRILLEIKEQEVILPIGAFDSQIIESYKE